MEAIDPQLQLQQAWARIEGAIATCQVEGFGAARQENPASGSHLVVSWVGPPPVSVLRKIDELRLEAVDVRIEECPYTAEELDAEVRRLAMSAREQGLRFWSIGPNAAASGIELWVAPPGLSSSEQTKLMSDYPLTIVTRSSVNPAAM